MGCAYRVMPGKPHMASLSIVLPIENSPPGIQTIPVGATPGAELLFSIVGRNEDGGSFPAHSMVFGRFALNAKAAKPTTSAVVTSHFNARVVWRAGGTGSAGFDGAFILAFPQPR